jgi:hypothetical protein
MRITISNIAQPVHALADAERPAPGCWRAGFYFFDIRVA